MTPPVSDQSEASLSARRRRSGRFRGYAVASAPRPSRKAVRFRCRNCGQKVLVDRGLRRAVITCPTCQELIPAPQRARVWLEICGAILSFLAGLAIGHAPASKPPLPPTSATVTMSGTQGHPVHPKGKQPKPSWFTNNQDVTP